MEHQQHTPIDGAERIKRTIGDATEVTPTSTITAWPEPPNAAAFYGLAGDFVRAVEPFTEADPVALLIQFLVAFGCAAGHHLHRVVERDRHHLNFFAVLVGVTSKARKGSSWSWVEDVFKLVDEPFITDRMKGGLSSGEGLIWNVRDPISEPQRRGKGHESHLEFVETDPGITDKRLLIYESEFSSALRVAARTENILTEIIRRAWDGNHPLQTLTKASPVKGTGAHIAIVAHITDDELQERLDRADVANGFANRFVFFCVKRSKMIPIPVGPGHEIEQVLGGIAAKLREAIDFARQEHHFEFSQSAREMWIRVYPSLSEGAPGMLGAILARAEAQVLRLAMIYSAIDQSLVIDVPHLKAALALWDYADSSAAFIFGDSLGNPDADLILDALRKNKQQGLSRTDIRDLFSKNLTAPRIERALLVLTKNKKARCESAKPNGAGRPREMWFAN
jgi:hypothetical protein